MAKKNFREISPLAIKIKLHLRLAMQYMKKGSLASSIALCIPLPEKMIAFPVFFNSGIHDRYQG